MYHGNILLWDLIMKLNEKAIKFTNLISFLALRIYKYKMRCRIEKKMNPQMGYYVM